MEEIIKAIMAAQAVNRANAGKEFYRHDYDLALHIKVAIENAGFKIIRKSPKPSVRYWANQGGDIGLRNGSFIRTKVYNGKTVMVQWMNGDCMGQITKIPQGFTEVDTAHAESLIPKCCM